MMAEVTLPYRYGPRSYHRRIYAAWQRGVRQLLVVMHRRAGKTKGLVNLCPMAMVRRQGNYAHVFPELKQAREVVWDGIDHAGARYISHFPPLLLYKQPNHNDLKITFTDLQQPGQPGSTYTLFGTDRNVNALVGANPVGILWDEWSLQNPLARDLARPILVENGGFELLAYTPRGENHGYDLFQFASQSPDWHVEYLTVDDTRRDGPGEDGRPVITHADIERERKELQARGVPGVDALIEQEYFLSWQAPMPGAYYADELLKAQREQRITRVPHDPTRRVYTGWDLGTSKAHDTNSLWFVQIVGGRVLVIDYHQASNKGIPYYVDLLERKGYLYATHYALETDLDETDWGSGKTRGEQLKEFGITFTTVPKLPLVDGISAVRMVLARCYFDSEACRQGLGGLRSYKREWDDQKRIFADHPAHDFASHPADAFRYLAVGLGDPYEEERSRLKGRRPGRPAAGVGFDPLGR
jgi:phage terminase large subunit